MNAAILLAAGKSTRMGKQKALLQWGNQTLIEAQIIEIARSNVKEIVVVTGYKHNSLKCYVQKLMQKYKQQVHFLSVYNDKFEQGKTSSIRLGIASISDPQAIRAIAVVGVDQPVRSETLNFLFSRLDTHDILIPAYKGKKGHPPVFSSVYLDSLKEVTEEKQGLRNIMKIYNKKVKVINVAEPQVSLNLNYLSDYKLARKKNLDSYC